MTLQCQCNLRVGDCRLWTSLLKLMKLLSWLEVYEAVWTEAESSPVHWACDFPVGELRGGVLLWQQYNSNNLSLCLALPCSGWPRGNTTQQRFSRPKVAPPPVTHTFVTTNPAIKSRFSTGDWGIWTPCTVWRRMKSV